MEALLPHVYNLDGYHFERRKGEQNSCQIFSEKEQRNKSNTQIVCNALTTHTLITLRCEDFIYEKPSLEAFHNSLGRYGRSHCIGPPHLYIISIYFFNSFFGKKIN
jgi:hypothetical protein